MPESERLVIKNLPYVPYLPTSHGVGYKQVLLANDETESRVTQIAKYVLSAGSIVEEHVHQSMDEHFIFLEGEGEIAVNGTVLKCVPGIFVLVAAQNPHSLIAHSDLIFITFSVAI